MIDTTNSDWKIIEKDGYKIYQSGSHKNGNFIQLYAPTPSEDAAGDDKQPKKLKLLPSR